MKKLIIHIGYHKTGTTFLNRKFFKNHPQIHHMGKPYAHDDPIREMIERIIGVKKFNVNLCKSIYKKNILPIQKNKIITISDGQIVKQNFVRNLQSIPERMLDIFGEVSVIIVIRRQYDYVKSLYVQHIGVNNEKKTFDEWFDDNWDSGGLIKSRMDYFSRIKAYIDVLGRENVGIFMYEQLQKNPDMFINDMCNFMECDCSIFHEEGDKKALNKRMTTLHYFINKNNYLRLFSVAIKRVIPIKVHSFICSFIFSKFSRYEPELSKDRIKLIQEYSHVVNNKLTDKFNLELNTYNYD